jgi:hypothetical protein
VLKADGICQWLKMVQVVPRKKSIVEEHAAQAQEELKDVIISYRTNTRSSTASIEEQPWMVEVGCC